MFVEQRRASASACTACLPRSALNPYGLKQPAGVSQILRAFLPHQVAAHSTHNAVVGILLVITLIPMTCELPTCTSPFVMIMLTYDCLLSSEQKVRTTAILCCCLCMTCNKISTAPCLPALPHYPTAFAVLGLREPFRGYDTFGHLRVAVCHPPRNQVKCWHPNEI